jgi:hypothetical protein
MLQTLLNSLEEERKQKAAQSNTPVAPQSPSPVAPVPAPVVPPATPTAAPAPTGAKQPAPAAPTPAAPSKPAATPPVTTQQPAPAPAAQPPAQAPAQQTTTSASAPIPPTANPSANTPLAVPQVQPSQTIQSSQNLVRLNIKKQTPIAPTPAQQSAASAPAQSPIQQQTQQTTVSAPTANQSVNTTQTSPQAQTSKKTQSTSTNTKQNLNTDPNLSDVVRRKKISEFNKKELNELLDKPYEEINKLVETASGRGSKKNEIIVEKEINFINEKFSSLNEALKKENNINTINVSSLKSNFNFVFNLFDKNEKNHLMPLYSPKNYILILKKIFKKDANFDLEISKAIEKMVSHLMTKQKGDPFLYPNFFKEQFLSDIGIKNDTELQQINEDANQNIYEKHENFIVNLELIFNILNTINEDVINLDEVDISKI